MADPFGRGSGGGGGSDPFGRGKGGSHAPSKPHGVSGLFHNLGQDVKDSAVGFFPGLYHTFDDPVGTAKAVGASYKQTYGHDFLHHFYEHPLGPIMDALTVATLPFGIGEGLAGSRTATALGKAGLIDSEAGSLVKASRAMHASHRTYELRGARSILADGGKLKGFDTVVGGDNVGSVLDRRQLDHAGLLPRRYVASKIDQLLKMAPAETKLIGEIARYGRAQKLLLKRGPRALGMKMGEFQASLHKLNDDERAAVHLHLTGVKPDEYANLLKTMEQERGTSLVRQKMIEHVSRPEIRDAYDSYGTNGRLTYAVEKGRELAHELTGYRTARATAAASELTDNLNAQYDNERAQIGKEPTYPANAEPADMTKIKRAHDEKLLQLEERRKKSLAGVQEDLATSKRLLTDRPLLHARLVRGARFMQTYHAPALAKAEEAIAKRQAELEHLHGQETLWLKDAQQHGTPLPSNPYAADITKKSELLESLTKHRDQLEKGLATKHAGGDVEKLHEMANQSRRTRRDIIDTEASSPEAVRAEFQKAGRAEPVYVPDMTPPDALKGAKVSLNRAGGTGPAAFKNDARMRQNQAVLYLSGKIALDPESLGVAFRDFTRRQYLEAIHDQLLQSAVHNSGDLPKGWVWIKENAGERLPKRPGDLAEERGHGGETTAQMLEKIIDRTGNTTHLMVPEGLVDSLTQQFTRSDRFIRRLWEKPTTVWRAMVLNLRVGWLTNNLIGQHMLLWFHYAGPDMIQAWISYLRDLGRTRDAAELTGLKQTRPFKELERKYAGQEIHGTQFRSQTPGLDPLDDSVSLTSKAGQKFTEFTNKVGQFNAKVSEDIPREIAMRTHVIREGRRLGLKISTEANHFDKLAENILSHPHLADRAMAEADRALGDYTTLSDFEKKVVRQLIPFYAWLRAITKIVLNATVDTPGRVALAARLGQVGEEWIREKLNNGQELPDYLRALMPIFGGTINTKSASPFGSVPDVMDFLGALVRGKPGDIGRFITPNLSPFIQGGIEALTGKTAVGADAEQPPAALQGLLGDMVWKNFSELPLSRIGIAAAGKHRVSKLYGPDTAERELWSYLGIPYRPRPNVPPGG